MTTCAKTAKLLQPCVPAPMPVTARIEHDLEDERGRTVKIVLEGAHGLSFELLVEPKDDGSLDGEVHVIVGDERNHGTRPFLIHATGTDNPLSTAQRFAEQVWSVMNQEYQELVTACLSANDRPRAKALITEARNKKQEVLGDVVDSFVQKPGNRWTGWKRGFVLRAAAGRGLRITAKDLNVDAPTMEQFYDIAVRAMRGGDVTTFDAFVQKLRDGLGAQFSPFIKALGGYTGLRPVWDAVIEHDADDLQNSLEEMRISPRKPWAKENPGGKPREVPLDDPHGPEKLQPGLEPMSRDEQAFAFNVAMMETYPNFKGIAGKGTVAQQAEAIITQMKDNLLWLYNSWGKNLRDRSKAWYVGGNRLIHRWARKFGAQPNQIAGVIAALSPQQQWFQNITLAERVITALKMHADDPWDRAMTKLIMSGGVWGKATGGEPSPKMLLPELEGKTLNQLKAEGSLYKMAIWVRAWDESHNPNMCREMTPEGEFGDWLRKSDGEPERNRWQSFPTIIKAIQSMEAPTGREISDIISENHKVRSFYNNLIAPASKGGDVTIDTHAVAAALLRPLSGNSREVRHNFGQNFKPSPDAPGEPGPTLSGIHGNNGLYGFYAEAYRRAAQEAGVLPRELQSITWEAVRGLFEVKIKGTKGVSTQQAIDQAWEDHNNGGIDANTAREQILEHAEGISAPSWSRPHSGGDEIPRDSSYQSELPGHGPSGGGGAPPRRTGSGTPGAVPHLAGGRVAKLLQPKGKLATAQQDTCDKLLALLRDQGLRFRVNEAGTQTVYVVVQTPAGPFKIRIADHPTPVYKDPRHQKGDDVGISLDPVSGKTVEDAVAALKTSSAMAGHVNNLCPQCGDRTRCKCASFIHRAGDIPETHEVCAYCKRDAAKTAEKIEDGTYSMPLTDAIDEHVKLVDALKSPSHKDDAEEAKDQGSELKEMQEAAKKTAKHSQPKGYEDESKVINENAKTPEARKAHRFRPATWTLPNGHPRCKLCGDEEPVGGTCSGASRTAKFLQPKQAAGAFIIPPKLAPYVNVVGGLSSARQWTTKVWLGNSGTKDHTEVAIVGFDPATGTVIPVAASDEHQNGIELMQFLIKKKLIPALPYTMVFLDGNYVDSTDPDALQKSVALYTAWRRLGGANTSVRSRYLQPGFVVSMDDFIKAKGNVTTNYAEGELAPLGARLIKSLSTLVQIFTQVHSSKAHVSNKALIRAGHETLEALKHTRLCSWEGLQAADRALMDVEAGGDPTAFEQAIFTGNGLKNDVHNRLRAYGKNQFMDRDLVEIFGDPAQALHAFNGMTEGKTSALKLAAPTGQAPPPSAETYELENQEELSAFMTRFLALRVGTTVAEGFLITADDQRLSFLAGPDFWDDDRFMSFSEGFNKRVTTDRYPINKITPKAMTAWVIGKLKGQFPMTGALKQTNPPRPGPLTAQQIASGGLDKVLAPIKDTMYRFWVLKTWALRNYEQVGEDGSSRIAFKLDEDHALKIAKNPAGIAQNLAESHLAQNFHDLPITQVHHVANGGVALVVDFAHELNPAHFKQDFGMAFKDFGPAIHNIALAETPEEEEMIRASIPPKARGLISALEKHGLATTDLMYSDQWGDFKNHAVILDYGLTHDVWQEHYNRAKGAKLLMPKVKRAAGIYDGYCPICASAWCRGGCAPGRRRA